MYILLFSLSTRNRLRDHQVVQIDEEAQKLDIYGGTGPSE